MQFKDYWNAVFKQSFNKPIIYDDWLEQHKNTILFTQKPILDLGCGDGSDTLYLKKLGLNVISLDYSDVAINKLKQQITTATTLVADISKPLPFDDSSFDLIIADLSLHYFDDSTTKAIMKEIKRVLVANGHLIARVNSIKDINFGAGQGEEIEHNYYYVNGYNKRFFDLIDTIKYFSIIGDVKVEEDIMARYGKPKMVYKVFVEKL